MGKIVSYTIQGLIILIFGFISACNNSGHNNKAENNKKVDNSVDGNNVNISGVNRKIHINLPDLLDVKKNFSFSKLHPEIEYIPIETTDKYLIGDKRVRVKSAGEYIFISEHQKPVGMFSREGKFIRTIGSIGKGPKEYNFDYVFWPDKEQQRIYVWNAIRSTIMRYSWKGDFIGEMSPEINPHSFLYLGDNRFLIFHYFQQQKDSVNYRFFITDEQGNTIKRFSENKIEYDFPGGFIGINSPQYYKINDSFLIQTWENDSLFRIVNDDKIETALSWNLGRYKIDFNIMSNYDRYKREKHKYIMDFDGIESNNKWFIHYTLKSKLIYSIFDKNSGEFYNISNIDNDQKGLFNDVDGGPAFWPWKRMDSGNTSYELFYAPDLLEMQEKGELFKTELTDKEQSMKFEKLLSGLTDNDNPIIRVVKIR